MALSLKESNAVRGLARCLAEFLPATGSDTWKGHITFQTVADQVGVAEFWPALGSKTPRLAKLLEGTLSIDAAGSSTSLWVLSARVCYTARARASP
jgi:hypothetical protein